GGVPGRAGVVRSGGDRRVAVDPQQDRRRRARRRGDGVDHRQLDPEDPRGRSRAAHDARHADSVVLRRLTMDDYTERISRTRAAYKEARERFAARLRDAFDADVHRAPARGGWSAAQIGWHVAAVDTAF